MARPITWQDVAAPRGAAAAIEVFGRGGDRLAQAVQNMGQVAVDYRNSAIEENTDKILASIMTSQDPASVAATVPQDDWKVDQLAVAKATNQRTDQLLDTKAKNTNIRAAELNIEDMLSRQEDRESARLLAGEIMPLAETARSGGDFYSKIDKTNPLWKTKSGMEGLKYLEDLRAAGQEEKSREQTMRFQRNAEARAVRQENEQKAVDAANAEILLYNQGAGAGKTPAERQRDATAIYQKHGAPIRALPSGLAAAELGAQGSAASPEDLARKVEGTSLTYGDLIKQVDSEVEAAQFSLNRYRAENANSLNLANLTATNDYKGLTDGNAAQLFLKKFEGQIGKGLAPNWGPNDVIQRAEFLQDWARKRGYSLEQDQAFMLVEKTIGSFTPFDVDEWIITDSILNDIKGFDQLRKDGGYQQVLDKDKQMAQNFEAAKAAGARKAVNVHLASRGQVEAPKDLIEGYSKNPSIGIQRAEADLLDVQMQLRNADQLTSNELAALRVKRDAAEKRINELKRQLAP